MYQKVHTLSGARPRKLIETLAEEISQMVLGEFQVKTVLVELINLSCPTRVLYQWKSNVIKFDLIHKKPTKTCVELLVFKVFDLFLVVFTWKWTCLDLPTVGNHC